MEPHYNNFITHFINILHNFLYRVHKNATGDEGGGGVSSNFVTEIFRAPFLDFYFESTRMKRVNYNYNVY